MPGFWRSELFENALKSEKFKLFGWWLMYWVLHAQRIIKPIFKYLDRTHSLHDWRTFCHVQDMSRIFPTKFCNSPLYNISFFEIVMPPLQPPQHLPTTSLSNISILSCEVSLWKFAISQSNFSSLDITILHHNLPPVISPLVWW